ncbi:hypothetical protein [Leptolyngbya sp. FACHB-17]|uniref:hypothetical protein n=1 Tax=Leptolyngbya sp. FACHB-17 TaxID=2692803 RepID=UPI00167FECA4|nr:hypothetical protein [Leptolyngbya sp. FACHB-17]MBD2079872.1 hypothetical protein [Leptolyngbya sp. FACHB-17]
MKNEGQFGRCETTVLSDPGSCPLTNCHPGADFDLRFVWGWESCSCGVRSSTVAQVRTQQKWVKPSQCGGTGALLHQVIDNVTEVAATESPPSKEESSNSFWQTAARAKLLGGSPKL